MGTNQRMGVKRSVKEAISAVKENNKADRETDALVSLSPLLVLQS